MKAFLFAFCAIGLFACQPESLDIGKVSNFLPSATQLKKGVAYKYYTHGIPTDKNGTNSTNIEYSVYQFTAPDILTRDIYNAGMQLTMHNKYKCQDDKMIILERYTVIKGDTNHYKIIENVELDWSADNQSSEIQATLTNGVQRHLKTTQVARKDTLIEEMNCIKIDKKGELVVVVPDRDTINYPLNLSYIYAEKLGLYASYTSFGTISFHNELIEQMSVAEFEKRANNGRKRIAYIDPQKTIDNNPDFKICNKEIQIGDYYNRGQRSELRGGKGSWWRIIDKDVDDKVLNNESGFLTYRFVLNCEGETGRFITEEADLNYKEKQFAPATTRHLYEVVAAQTDWLVSQEKDDTQDAYTYITFKLKDGKITDILP